MGVLRLLPRRRRLRGSSMAALRGRKLFAEDLDREVLRAARSGQPACLVLLRLKRDQAARSLLSVMATELRAVDLRYRLGADEFALILPDTRARGGLVAAGRIEESLLLATGTTELAAGVAELGPRINGDQLLRNAVSALQLAGRRGHCTVLAYSPLLEDEIEPAHSSARSHR